MYAPSVRGCSGRIHDDPFFSLVWVNPYAVMVRDRSSLQVHQLSRQLADDGPQLVET